LSGVILSLHDGGCTRLPHFVLLTGLRPAGCDAGIVRYDYPRLRRPANRRAVGVLPSFETIGIWATVLLVVFFRILQGLAVGGQWGGGILLAAEYAPTEKRGFYASLAQLGILVGLFLGNVLFLMLRSKAKNPVSHGREEW
jgi:hypothetical protein